MKAYVVGADGPAITDVAQPRPGNGQVLVRVKAAALNRADLGMARGRAHGARGGAGTVLGSECAGEVVEAGADATSLKAGDRVMCSTTGAFAEYALTDHLRAYRIPDGFDFARATTLPTSLSTMHNAVVTEGALKPGQSAMIQGASSGVGLMAMQIAKLKGASLVIGTSTDAGRRARLKEFGADLAIDPNAADWVDQILAATNGQGVDLIVDQVSGKYVNDLMRATRLEGRIVNVGRLGGERSEFNFDLHALRRIKYIGVTFRTRTVEEIRAISEKVRADLWPAVVSGKLSLPIDKAFPFAQVADAFAHMAANKHLGKIVLTFS
jgi:NADPH2:quinone reductase